MLGAEITDNQTLIKPAVAEFKQGIQQEAIMAGLLTPFNLRCEQLVQECDQVVALKEELANQQLALLRIDEITFEDKAPRKEALENIISALQITGINFVYLIKGDKQGVKFYFGLAKDLRGESSTNLTINELRKNILRPSVEGNFRGSKTVTAEPEEKRSLRVAMKDYAHCACLCGVPGIVEDNEKYQSVDRLADVMLGSEFMVMILAKPLDLGAIAQIEKDLFDMYSYLNMCAKKSLQMGINTGESVGKSKGFSKSETQGKSDSHSETKGSNTSVSDTDGTSKSTSTTNSSNSSKASSSSSSGTGSSKTGQEGSSHSKTTGSGNNESRSTSISTSTSTSTSENTNDSESKNSGTSSSINVELAEKAVQDWVQYFDNNLLKRVDYGKGKGLFSTAMVLFSKDEAGIIKLENTFRALYSGESGNKVPFQKINIEKGTEIYQAFCNFQIPTIKLPAPLSVESKWLHASWSTYCDEQGRLNFGNWLSTNELSLIAGLPQKEVVGLKLKEEVEFGLNYEVCPHEEQQIALGNLIQGGTQREIVVSIDKNNLDKHTFITGVTGSGKTTTCQRILLDSGLPFLVIEPAKTEYRILSTRPGYEDMLIFTLGNENVAPFRLNPFEFMPGENITSRVDMLKATIEAAFDMEAAIPQLIEEAIYACYEDYGWNFSDNSNEKFAEPFADGVYAFPTFSDLLAKVATVVENKGFDDRLKNDYIGSIKARLQGLTMGAKGFMLDTKRSVDFSSLLERKVVLELEEIRSSSEKALVMGFILLNLTEAMKGKYRQEKKAYHHITLIEEAHRLLSRYAPGDSLNKKQSIETFADMLAEVRKYGESLIIVDQIPGKLTPEVLKNTNTKIVHKIFAQDDKDAIGNTMVLSEEQKGFLSNLDPGRAIVFSQGWSKAIQVQIKQGTNTTEELPTEDHLLRRRVLDYYRKIYRRGIFPGISELNEEPTLEQFQAFVKIAQKGKLSKDYRQIFKAWVWDSIFAGELKAAVKIVGLAVVIDYIRGTCYAPHSEVTKVAIGEFLSEVLAEETLKSRKITFATFTKLNLGFKN